MIAKLVKGKGFRGVLEYALRQEKGNLLDTNMAGSTPRELAREFGEARALRPNLSKAVCHMSLSIAPDERLTDEQWKDVAQKTLSGMGFDDCQFVVAKHHGTKHPHIHILASRVSMNGEVVSDSQDFRRLEGIMRRLEKEYGLREVLPSREAQRRAPTKGEIECAVRTGKPSEKILMQSLVDKALAQGTDYKKFCFSLERQGVAVLPNMASTGRISGISFTHNDITMKGSDLGKGYTWGGLQKGGYTMSKTDMLRSLSENNPGQPLNAPSEVMETIGSIHEKKVKDAEELAQLLEPLLSVMLKITADTAQSLEALSQSSKYIKQQQQETCKTWEYLISKMGIQAGAIQSAQKDTSVTAKEIHAGIQESTRQIRAIAKLSTRSLWIYPLATAALVSLLWTGFVYWRMPDYDTILQYQNAIYDLIKEQGKNPGQAVGRK